MPETFYRPEEIALLNDEARYPNEPRKTLLKVLDNYEDSLDNWIRVAGMEEEKRNKLHKEVERIRKALGG